MIRQDQTSVMQDPNTDFEVYLNVVYSEVATRRQHGASILEVPLSQFLTHLMKETGQTESTERKPVFGCSSRHMSTSAEYVSTQQQCNC